jgi:hypothetical protein
MFSKTLPSLLAVCLCVPLAANTQTPPKLTAAQVVEKSIAARGGLQAWGAVQTMTFTGKMDAGGGHSIERSRAFRQGRVAPTSQPDANKKDADQQVQLPFTLELKRPRKSRLELQFNGKTAVQVYDGTNGWKLRPFLNRNDVEPFTPDELQSEGARDDLDGYLVDYAAKGTKVELEGVEPVEGHNAYKLKLTLKGGQVQHVWIDAQNFLEVRLSGSPRRMDGKMRNVYVYLRDYKSQQGLMIPYVLETSVEGYKETHKMVIESVLVNPKLEDALFTKPEPK